VVKPSGAFIEAACVPGIGKSELLKIEMMANSWQRVLRNVPKEVTSLRPAVRIQTRISIVSGA
jgi:hypothetical protein